MRVWGKQCKAEVGPTQAGTTASIHNSSDRGENLRNDIQANWMRVKQTIFRCSVDAKLKRGLLKG